MLPSLSLAQVKSLEDFDERFPGFGGFLPWFCSRGVNDAGYCMSPADTGSTGITPLPDWASRLPGGEVPQTNRL